MSITCAGPQRQTSTVQPYPAPSCQGTPGAASLQKQCGFHRILLREKKQDHVVCMQCCCITADQPQQSTGAEGLSSIQLTCHGCRGSDSRAERLGHSETVSTSCTDPKRRRKLWRGPAGPSTRGGCGSEAQVAGATRWRSNGRVRCIRLAVANQAMCKRILRLCANAIEVVPWKPALS